jgi:histidyl-tRNA synthetase
MKQKSTQPARGTRDTLPGEMRLRSEAFSRIINAYQQFGFSEIETPAIENLENLAGANAGENTKLIFAIMKRGDALAKALDKNERDQLADLGLRFDLTLPLARYYAENRAKLPKVFKAIQIGNVWRAERPQKGRYRQFYQCDIDIIGNASFLAEIELLAASTRALVDLGFEGFKLLVNDRRILTALVKSVGISDDLRDSIFIVLDKLDKIGMDKVKQELNGLGLNNETIEQLMDRIIQQDSPRSLKELLPLLEGYIDPSVVNELEIMINEISDLSKGKFECVFDPTLVRGLGYYTGPVFEVTYKDYPFSIAGGGRYDTMVGDLVGVDTPACGISIGFDRMMGILEEEKLLKTSSTNATALIYDKKTDPVVLMKITNDFWKKDQSITLYKREKNFGKQLTDFSLSGVTEYYNVNEEGELSELKRIEA